MRPALLAVLLAFVVSGCGSTSGGAGGIGRTLGLAKGVELSYGEVQAITVGLSAEQVRDAFGEPTGSTRGADGKLTRMEYPALDGRGTKARLFLDLDAREVVSNKTFTGAILRP